MITCYRQLVNELPDDISNRQSFRLAAIPNTVDVNRFTPEGRDDAVARKRWREGAEHVVVTVGHLSEVKGYPTFLRAAAQIRAAMPGCRFLAVGGETLEPGYGERLRQMADGLGLVDAVQFLGWRTDVPEILRSADVMVLASLAEGLPLAVLEAMACGLPVVATDVNGTPEAVLDGETGFLVRPNDPETLALKVAALLSDSVLRDNMGAAGRRHVEDNFTLTQFLQRVQGLYDQIVAA